MSLSELMAYDFGAVVAGGYDTGETLTLGTDSVRAVFAPVELLDLGEGWVADSVRAWLLSDDLTATPARGATFTRGADTWTIESVMEHVATTELFAVKNHRPVPRG